MTTMTDTNENGPTATDEAPPTTEPPVDPELQALSGRVADRSALALLLSVGVVGTVVGFGVLLTLTNSLMRGSAATGFELVGRSLNYSEALAFALPTIVNTLPAVAIGVVSALLATVVLQWIDQVGVAKRGPRWAIALFPLVVAMPVRAAGLSHFMGPDRPIQEDRLTAGVAISLIWLSAGIPLATLIGGVGRRWAGQRTALILAAPITACWVALDGAAPALVSRHTPSSTLGPLIDTSFTLTGLVPRGAALTVMATAVLILPVLLAASAARAWQRGHREQAHPVPPMSTASWVGLAGTLVLAYGPMLLTLGVALAGGARPWQICAPPTGCLPITTTALMVLPTAVMAAALAGTAYYAGWLVPANRRFGFDLVMVSGFLLPPTTLGVALWLVATWMGLGVGLLTLFVGQAMLATAMAYAAVNLAQLGQPTYQLGEPVSAPRRLLRASAYAGGLGALFASGDFGIAEQLSGPLRTVPTIAFAEAVNIGSAGPEVLAALMWALLTFPVFLWLMSRIMGMIPEAPAAEAQPAAPPAAG